MELDQVPSNREAEAGTGQALTLDAPDLVELVEHALALRERNSRTGILDGQANEPLGVGPRADGNLRSRRTELDRVSQQVRDHLMHLVGIRPDRLAGRHIHVDANLPRGGDMAETVDGVADDVSQGERLREKLDLPRLDASQVEEVGHHAAEPVGVVSNPAEVVARLVGQWSGYAVQEVVDIALDGGQRRPQLVRNVSEEIGLELIELSEPRMGGRELEVGGLELGRPRVHFRL